MDIEDQTLNYRNSHEPQMKWKMATANYHESPKSSLRFTAQARNYEEKIKKIKINPFEPDDPSVLGKNTCSPGMLVTAPEPDEFSWSIDDISKINPAPIESPHFARDEYDESKERIAQEAIAKYFSSTHNVLSPEDAYQGTWMSPAASTPSVPSSMKTMSSTPKVKTRSTSKIDVGTQTIYSFPVVLPPELEEILKPYIRDINVESDENNIFNTSTLRRKLLFNQENDEDLNPSRFHGSLTPSPVKTDIRSRINWSAEIRENHDMGSAPSSPDLSPIRTREDNMSVSFPEISSISNAEVSMITIESPKVERMIVSADEHNRIFSSTVVANVKDTNRFESGAESGYATYSYDASLKL